MSAPEERPCPEARDAVGNDHACESAAARERIVLNPRDAAWDHETGAFGGRTPDQGRECLVEQHSIRARVGLIRGINIDGREVGAAFKRTSPDPHNAVADHHATKAAAVIERPCLNAGDAVGGCHAREKGALRERISRDEFDSVGDRVVAAFSGRTLNQDGDCLVEQNPIRARIDRIRSINVDGREAAAAVERSAPQVCDAGGDEYAREAGAAAERE